MQPVAQANEEAVEAWNGVLFDRWLKYRDVLVSGLSMYSDEALRLYPPPPGARVLDVGCGLGDTTRTIADLVGPEGEVVGIDAAAASAASATRAAASDSPLLMGPTLTRMVPQRIAG